MWLENPAVDLHPNGGGHPDVERIRSAHFNDVKIILPFLLITPLWLMSSPSSFIAKTVIRTFSLCKLLHTVCYMDLIKAESLELILYIICYCLLLYVCGVSSQFYVS